MTSNAKLLRNITTSGGLFTENILLRLRDQPNSKNIGKATYFYSVKEIEEIKNTGKSPQTLDSLGIKQRQERLNSLRTTIFDWAQRKWEEIFPDMKLHKVIKSDIEKKWLLPLFEQIGYELEPFNQSSSEEFDTEVLGDFHIKYQPKIPKVQVYFHFVSPYDDLDQKVKSNPKQLSHHEICQQFVNYHPNVKWLILSNGTQLRLLSTYYYSYSKGYVEFNLQDIFGGDLQEFKVMFNMIHPSRFVGIESEKKLLIEDFQAESKEEGVKVGDNLRDNVHNAIEMLGNKLIQQNDELYKQTKQEKIDLQKYYAELLRIIYRIIFILYAEQRNMLPGSGTLYFKNFSLSSFRMMAEKPIKNDSQSDLWQKLFLTFQLVKNGNKKMGVPCFNGSLFDNTNLSILFPNGGKEGIKYIISNDILLRIIRLLTTAQIGNILQRINFIEISEEEIGAIYESLLDYFPVFSKRDQFKLPYQTTERKGTGSYYTPKSLIDILLKTTLKPLIDDTLANIGIDPFDQEKAILRIKICDPACGGGTFLLSALDFIGEKLAKIRKTDSSPTEDDLRHARRDVLQNCIYGVDKNSLAVELCKISLWLRACVKDKPLNYLDNHIKCGNSLIGFGKNPESLLISDKNFKALKGNKQTGIESENKKLWNEIKKQVQDELKNLKKTKAKPGTLTKFLPGQELKLDIKKFQEISNMTENSIEEINLKKKKYTECFNREIYKSLKYYADAWTASFFWPLEEKNVRFIDYKYPNNTLLNDLKNGRIISKSQKILENISEISKQYQFFHWYLEFPEVFDKKKQGFDLILGNPPWDVIEFKENEFFIGKDLEITQAGNQSKRRELIKSRKNTNHSLWKTYKQNYNQLLKEKHFYSQSNFYFYTAKGKMNLYPLFTEKFSNLLTKQGRLGYIVPSKLITNYFMQDFFNKLVNEKKIISLFDFNNKENLFRGISSQQKFCLISLGNVSKESKFIPMAFELEKIEEINPVLNLMEYYNLEDISNQLNLDSKLLLLESNDFQTFNPNTKTCPIFTNNFTYKIFKKAYKYPILILRDESNNELKNCCNIEISTIFNAASDSNLFIEKKDLEKLKVESENKLSGGIWKDDKNKYLPLYAGKMVWQYDHRYQGIIKTKAAQRNEKSFAISEEQKKNIQFYNIPAYWIKEEDFMANLPKKWNKKWFFAFRDITGSKNERSLVCSIIPFYPSNHTLPIVYQKEDNEHNAENLCILIANFNTLIMDYIARQKISSQHMSFYVVEQLPVIPFEKYPTNIKALIVNKILKLSYNSLDLEEFAKDLNFTENPFIWNEEIRLKIKCEIDAIYALLYKIERDELEKIIETFDVLEKKELDKYGSFKTKSLILDNFDKFAQKLELFE
ncbi:hypothetical protein NEF87_000480 [Candidatus Lokiarchaeum ossiferum]|uniref:site-specific DNA-methyltransferase (adenine-specific) n=1 Tax=Candidatus Lokiarchaeum ossiferum TaxID=2951803 RepID=A0ABY6HLB5_9ARCH|nr:hypothetical protein NEF87_000480 [Candidatus Lokiarchaeum sp. B-35]